MPRPIWYDEEKAAARKVESGLMLNVYIDAVIAARAASAGSTDVRDMDVLVTVSETKRANDMVKWGIATQEKKNGAAVLRIPAGTAGAAPYAKALAEVLTKAGWKARASLDAAL